MGLTPRVLADQDLRSSVTSFVCQSSACLDVIWQHDAVPSTVVDVVVTSWCVCQQSALRRKEQITLRCCHRRCKEVQKAVAF